jgi:structural maintenance of chromosome 4
MKNQMEDLDKSLKDNEKSVLHWSKKIEEMEEQLKSYDEVDEEEQSGEDKKQSGEEKSTSKPTTFRKSPEELQDLDEKKLNYDITILESEMEKMNPNMNAIKDYRAKAKLHEKRLAAFNEITEKRNAAVKEYDALRKKRLDEFMEGFRVITLKLKEIYQMVTLGGDAELELVDSLDPFSEGIVFSVRPPKKSWKNICNLSGGEKVIHSLITLIL